MRRFVAFTRTFLGLLLLGMVVLNVANAAGRYLFKRAIPGSDEILLFAMVWLVFIGAVLVAVRGDHLGFDLLPRSLPRPWAWWLKRLHSLAIAGLTGFVAWQSWGVLQMLSGVGQRSMATELPMVVPHASLFLCLTAICLVSLVQTFRPPGTEASGPAGPAEDDGS